MRTGIVSLATFLSLLTAPLDGAESRFSFSALPSAPRPELLAQSADAVKLPEKLGAEGVAAALAFGQSHYLYLKSAEDGVRVRLWHSITDTTIDGPVIFEGAVSNIEPISGSSTAPQLPT